MDKEAKKIFETAIKASTILVSLCTRATSVDQVINVIQRFVIGRPMSGNGYESFLIENLNNEDTANKVLEIMLTTYLLEENLDKEVYVCMYEIGSKIATRYREVESFHPIDETPANYNKCIQEYVKRSERGIFILNATRYRDALHRALDEYVKHNDIPTTRRALYSKRKELLILSANREQDDSNDSLQHDLEQWMIQLLTETMSAFSLISSQFCQTYF